MFKIGDIVKFKDEYYRDIKESYRVIWRTPADRYRVKGLITNKNCYPSEYAIELDYPTMRKLKIQMICSKLEIE